MNINGSNTRTLKDVARKISMLPLCHLIACPIWIHGRMSNWFALIRTPFGSFGRVGRCGRWTQKEINRYGLPKVGIISQRQRGERSKSEDGQVCFFLICFSYLQAWCGVRKEEWCADLVQIEQASWSMLENRKRCSCKIKTWLRELFESLSNTETRGRNHVASVMALLPWLLDGNGRREGLWLSYRLIYVSCFPCRFADIRAPNVLCFMDFTQPFGWTWLVHAPKNCRRLFSGLSCCRVWDCNSPMIGAVLLCLCALPRQTFEFGVWSYDMAC